MDRSCKQLRLLCPPDWGIYQVPPYALDFNAPAELLNPMSKTILSKCSFIWDKAPVIHTQFKQPYLFCHHFRNHMPYCPCTQTAHFPSQIGGCPLPCHSWGLQFRAFNLKKWYTVLGNGDVIGTINNNNKDWEQTLTRTNGIERNRLFWQGTWSI